MTKVCRSLVLLNLIFTKINVLLLALLRLVFVTDRLTLTEETDVILRACAHGLGVLPLLADLEHTTRSAILTRVDDARIYFCKSKVYFLGTLVQRRPLPILDGATNA